MSLVHDSGSRRGWFRAGWVAGTAIIAAVLLVAAVAVGARGRACDRWTGTASRRWNVSSNWSAGVPTSSTAVCISASARRSTVILDRRGAAATVSVGRGSGLSIGTGGRLRAVHGLNVAGTLAFASSTAALRTSLVDVVHGGVMTGVGAVHGSVVNAGAVAPADGGTGVLLRISGNYAQSSSGVLFSQQQGGFLRVDAGSASLAGRLDLLIEDALVPGTKIEVLSAGKLTGGFAYVTPGYVVHYRGRAVRVVVTPEIRLGRSPVRQGSAVAVFGASFGYGGTVRFRLDNGAGPVLGSANANSVGGFEGFAHVPATTRVGSHTLVATNTSFGYTAKTELTVTANDTA
jgi:hypothetical protein